MSRLTEYGDVLFIEVENEQELFKDKSKVYSIITKAEILPNRTASITPLPLGDYELIGLTNSMSEEDWKKILPVHLDYENMTSGYKDYRTYVHHETLYQSAKQSGLTLLTHLSLSGNQAVVRRVKK